MAIHLRALNSDNVEVFATESRQPPQTSSSFQTEISLSQDTWEHSTPSRDFIHSDIFDSETQYMKQNDSNPERLKTLDGSRRGRSRLTTLFDSESSAGSLEGEAEFVISLGRIDALPHMCLRVE